ncbi:hypothetical protein AA103196_3012 [Ameyamaea chiangmaiensis NBRC 103196]|uniref:DUF177 domain-containing protein n=1 Tax=Ameyamaea chiangmaiensis TaxID=442969 RepID=A0A850P3J6_9PROT|nr:DUF177 domain-containing protein [Ameyamaea chiangmaiensis]MBS4074499.1 DUF177 domain-containing protein [Ameyamaea chiangmaiensis]NVN39237.1 DUF177 domain-containing protein [Ameyamaea chiangmaiensis]GBQ72263.1 hypothetical protein AA103196_3012 [Ameyamaea chiangmaiensis NBRC 103196]
MAHTEERGAAPPVELSRLVTVGRIGQGPFEMTVEARESERHAIAARLGVPEVRALSCSYRVVAGHGRRDFVAHGQLSAKVRRVCVVSLEEFTETVAERFAVHFVPAGRATDDGQDPESMDDVPYEDDALDLGEESVAQLALALDPYPRKNGVRHEHGVDVAPADADGSEVPDEAPSAFAGLAKLRDRLQ